MKKCFILFLILWQICSNSYAEEAAITPHNNNIRLESPVDIAITCVFQHEAEWLKEWIEFHRLIGVKHFYLYNNLSDDDYLSVLEPYIDRGIVELFEYPQAPFLQKHQTRVYNHALSLAKQDNVKWLAIIDTDEFISPINTASLKSILEHYDTYPGIYVRWQMFGTSNVERLRKKELMIEKLVHRAPESHYANHFGKSIIQPHLTNFCRTPHECKYLSKESAHITPLAILRINHYYFRTEEFLHNVKIPRLRERLSNGVGNIFNPQSILKFAKVANKVQDITMQGYVAPLRKRVFSSTIPWPACISHMVA